MVNVLDKLIFSSRERLERATLKLASVTLIKITVIGTPCLRVPSIGASQRTVNWIFERDKQKVGLSNALAVCWQSSLSDKAEIAL